jgi:hypothetical protein
MQQRGLAGTVSQISLYNPVTALVNWDDGSSLWSRPDELVRLDEAPRKLPNIIAGVPQQGIKHDDGKNRVDLLPIEALEAVAEVLTFGAKKYEANNWRKGFAWTRLLGAALRHTFAFMRGQDKDPETGKSHIAHAACCLLFLLSHIITKSGTDDRVKTL